MFINSALLPFAIHFFLEDRDFYDEPNRIKNRYHVIYNTWLQITLIQPVIEIFSVNYFFQLFNIWRIRRKGEESLLTQEQANKYFCFF
jgi:hypothetical protein